MIETIGDILVNVIRIYSYLVIGYILLSWFPNARESSIGMFLARMVEPYLSPFRRIIPPLGMIDLSPIVALFALRFAEIGVKYLVQMF